MNKKLILSLVGLCGVSMALQGQSWFELPTDSIRVIKDGTFNSLSGSFNRTPAIDGGEVGQGVVVSFDSFNLGTVNWAVQAQFTLSGVNVNNSGFQLALGLFSGDRVTENAQTSVTDGWTGFFHSIGTRSSSVVFDK